MSKKGSWEEEIGEWVTPECFLSAQVYTSKRIAEAERELRAEVLLEALRCVQQHHGIKRGR